MSPCSWTWGGSYLSKLCERENLEKNLKGKVSFEHVKPMGMWSEVKVTQSRLTLCVPVNCTVHGILQVRILQRLAFPFSRVSFQPRDWTQVSCIAGGFFTNWASREAHGDVKELVKERARGTIESQIMEARDASLHGLDLRYWSDVWKDPWWFLRAFYSFHEVHGCEIQIIWLRHEFW